ncbi:DoxX family protein [Mycobacterium sp.]|jgi:uncharacterized membrane protein YphA (DoxX/SURF4 family)|uniref:DoxX family protein n=1 Tax=Mycobacterium sp. TaxID=1785 RepID=UPI002D2E0492|nr:DoxX family protein [Mycobacterium sp.]HZA10303.1 DoxX family protein [Mycobacterium sp.]
MNVALWVIAGLLAVAMLGAGSMKLVKSKTQLAANPQMAWAADFSPALIKFIGAVEFLAAIGLILPPNVGIAPVLVAVAAAGIVLLMIGAAVTHGRRGEYSPIAINVLLLALSAVVVWGRLGPYRF